MFQTVSRNTKKLTLHSRPTVYRRFHIWNPRHVSFMVEGDGARDGDGDDDNDGDDDGDGEDEIKSLIKLN